MLKILTKISQEQFINDLLSEMTLAEKIGQINQVGTSIYGGKEEHYGQLVREGQVGSFLSIKEIEKANALQRIAVEETRLGIPLLFAEDVVHGFLTTFPISLAESCTWNPQMMEQSARIAAEEAAAAGIHWTFAPMMDVSRDPRWGRVAESFGEDTFLTAEFGAAKVRGFQGKLAEGQLAADRLIACGKHFVGYSEAEAGRDYNTVDLSWYKLANVYLPPFKRLVDEGVMSIMSSFNALNGIPATVNKKLLVETLREKLAFTGLLISDWNALRETITHGFCKDGMQAVEKALSCQLDVDMSSLLYSSLLQDLIENDVIEESVLDRAVSRLLSLKWQVGLFDEPYRSSVGKFKTIENKQAEHRKAALAIAEESIVLLKNDGLLPLAETEMVGFAGPFLDDAVSMLDTWACKGSFEAITTVAKAVAERENDNYLLLYEAFAEFESEHGLSRETKQLIEKIDKVVLCLGEKATDSGEAKSKAILSLDQSQLDFLETVAQINPQTIVVLMNGRPLVLSEVLPQAKALVEAWHLGCEAGTAIVNILEGKTSPSGKLTMTFPKHEGQLPIYYNHYRTGRPYQPNKFNTSKYIDLTNEPEFPFGFGLSYTDFSLENMRVKKRENNRWDVAIEVTNNGELAGQEVVQLYIGAQYGSYVRPIKELKDFEKIRLAAGETTTVCFQIDRETFSYYDESFNKIFDPGEYLIMIGNSSQIAPTNIKRIEVES